MVFRRDATSQAGRPRSRLGRHGLADDAHHRVQLLDHGSEFQHICLDGDNRYVACCILEMYICHCYLFRASWLLRCCDRLFRGICGSSFRVLRVG